ncbi:F-box/LRR-repeat protein [Morus notabilis]|uniref:F-box/LRR-repeat protein n=1 Tax=Morus notabilis TaxID=981085 RepID=W9R4N6_9ROSA|nr:F-box/LRR-repeat protein 13 [Morus notabilis]EXB38078.1 F-box/LRR-repeat protein [Morus notabilis]
MARKQVKLNNGTKKDCELNAMDADRFSELPDYIIHKILSFLPTIDAVRMSLLSKRWRRMWYSLPALNFDDSAIVGDFNAKRFSKVVGNCLKLRKADMLAVDGDNAISKFRLATAKMWRWSSINGWLSLVSKSKVKELDLHVSSRSKTSFCLPPSILRIESLTCLRLANVEVEDVDSASLPSLTSLSLEKVKLSDQVLCDLVSRCCSLERLVLKLCHGLSNPKVSSWSVKFLEIAYTEFTISKMFHVEVGAVNLESFKCSGPYVSLDNLNLSLCATLRSLSFSCLSFDDQWLEDQILRLPLLECLTLRHCVKLERVRICSQRLKCLAFEGNGLFFAAEPTIDCPNLVYFSYEGYLSSNSTMTLGKNLLEAKIKCLNPAAYDTEWYMNLIEFFSNLNCPNNMSLDVCSEEALIFPYTFRKHVRSPLLTVKHMKVRTGTPSLGNPDLRDAINWLVPSLKTLSIE